MRAMITHGGARTRALYKWEEEDLKKREFVKPITKLEAHDIALTFHCQPSIEIRDTHSYPFNRGDLIVLTKERSNLIFIHELTHFVGFGTQRNPHSWGFVQHYIMMLNRWFGWDTEELSLQAHWRGLI